MNDFVCARVSFKPTDMRRSWERICVDAVDGYALTLLTDMRWRGQRICVDLTHARLSGLWPASPLYPVLHCQLRNAAKVLDVVRHEYVVALQGCGGNHQVELVNQRSR